MDLQYRCSTDENLKGIVSRDFELWFFGIIDTVELKLPPLPGHVCLL
jgi:hypothetical protein